MQRELKKLIALARRWIEYSKDKIKASPCEGESEHFDSEKHSVRVYFDGIDFYSVSFNRNWSCGRCFQISFHSTTEQIQTDSKILTIKNLKQIHADYTEFLNELIKEKEEAEK